MYQLESQSRPYAWGSRTAIPELQGRAPSGEPEAELWMGAHPGAPSKVPERAGLTLGELIAEHPEETLGARVCAQFDSQLPFLFKVLAAAEPLSLQAHPSLEQARAGFAKEEAAGIPRNAPNRNYKDDNHKPELICALTEFTALCGFRPVEQFARLLGQLDNPELEPFARDLEATSESEALERVFTGLMNTPRTLQQRLADTTVEAAKRAPASEFSNSFACVEQLGQKYPGDVGVVLSLMLNHVTLSPGQALYLPAGNLHAYLEGTGLELMANSDNVLRGGLTPKYVDVPELTRVLVFEPWPGNKQEAEATAPGQWRYRTDAPEFELWRIDVQGTRAVLASDGPEVLILIDGEVTANKAAAPLQRGKGVFVPASDGSYELSGHGTVYRALVP